MIRPAIQARRKLLFLYLLRSSSAIASEPHLAKSGSLSRPTPRLNGHIELRLATRTDVPFIQRCNLATLPENYSSNFYVNHLRQWPDLALVAEHVVPGGKRNPFESYDPSKPQNEIVGYVLGKVEEASATTAISLPPSRVESNVNNNNSSGSFFTPTSSTTTTTTQERTEMLGHVTSLAILPKFRRRGLAAKLMKQLHFHMQEGHDADGVGLHVRVSNVAARRLYCEGMGYGVVEVIRGYYQDEDAFFMRKNFLKEHFEDTKEIQEQKRDDNQRGVTCREGTLSRFSLSRMRKSRRSNAGQFHSVWESGPEEFRLPKIIPLNDGYEASDINSNVVNVTTNSGNAMDDSSEEEAHVMTGSL